MSTIGYVATGVLCAGLGFGGAVYAIQKGHVPVNMPAKGSGLEYIVPTKAISPDVQPVGSIELRVMNIEKLLKGLDMSGKVKTAYENNKIDVRLGLYRGEEKGTSNYQDGKSVVALGISLKGIKIDDEMNKEIGQMETLASLERCIVKLVKGDSRGYIANLKEQTPASKRLWTLVDYAKSKGFTQEFASPLCGKR